MSSFQLPSQIAVRATVLNVVAARLATLCVSAPILAEYEGVLLRPKLHLDPLRVRWLLDLAATDFAARRAEKRLRQMTFTIKWC
jgi:hypothetical protein